MSILINKYLEILLKILGFWHKGSNSLGPAIMMSTLITTFPFQCWKAYSMLNNPLLLMDILSDILAELLIFIKFFAMWAKKKEIEELLGQIDRDWSKDGIPSEWKKNAHLCNIFCKFDLALYLGAVIFYYPDIINKYLNMPIENRLMMLQSQYPFAYQASPTYELLNLLQIIQAWLVIFVDTLSKSLLVAYILHVSARIHLLKNLLEEYSESCMDYSKYESVTSNNLRHVIQEHLNILLLVRKVDSIYSYVCLFQIAFSSIIICVTGFVVVTALESADFLLMVKFVLFILAMLWQAFTFCMIGQYLCNKGESIVNMLYDSYWYRSNPRQIKSMIVILATAQKPLILRGGNIFEISISTFAQIVKSSFSYLSVLRAAYD
ncbi:hypothetical protein QAD02_015413 [Eretmocerus hayati]|uniref:Uncharacterized protein n=1 Tax=Eretmocerus hayati TaxID=131215 RepID=A0ACC2P866_9HYME|nr:hypothetical protein QAD02_015413 [Eretmocerus hayati]